jgi:hypothetical protein
MSKQKEVAPLTPAQAVDIQKVFSPNGAPQSGLAKLPGVFDGLKELAKAYEPRPE